MKKRRIGMSLIIALLMLVPAFTVGATGGETEESLVVIKEVFDGEEWVSAIYAEMDDVVQFRITITYYNITDPEHRHYATHIVVNDTLPDCLAYVQGSSDPQEPEIISDKYLVWKLDLYEVTLEHEESYIITFNTTVVDYGVNVNEVDVKAIEICTGIELHGYGEATVTVEEPPEPEPLDFDKEVWNPEKQEWVEDLLEVRKDTPVKFQITATYQGEDPEHFIDCGVIGDYLPDVCLEYVKTTSVKVAGEELTPGTEEYPYIVPDAGDIIEICGEPINISELMGQCEGTLILWDFRGAWNFELHNGESIIIEFETNVTEYCECTFKDWAFALLWGCYPCDPENYYFGCDTANVTCNPPDPIFDKKAWDGNSWIDDTSVFVGDLVKYKIELTYFGNHYLADIRIVDKLPCILEYADNANIKESNVSADLKTIWWNLTTIDINDSETLTIEYYALVTGVSDCPDCGTNIATYTARECETQKEFTGEADAKITSQEKPTVKVTISFKPINIGRVTAYICNEGEVDISDIEWTISAKVGLLGLTKREASGTIETLEVDSCKGVSTYTNLRSRIVRRFGRVIVNVTATFDGETVYALAAGRVFGRIIFVSRVDAVIQ